MSKPNWQKVVKELLTTRTQLELKELTGVPQSTISALLNGESKERLTYNNGVALLNQLHADRQTKTPSGN